MRWRFEMLIIGSMVIWGGTGAVTNASSRTTIERSTIDSGGLMRSSGAGGRIELSGTVGQFDAGGAFRGTSIELTGGFWFGIMPGDCDEDGGITLRDYDELAGCLAGPETEPPERACDCFDLDGDRDVDLVDFSSFQLMMNNS